MKKDLSVNFDEIAVYIKSELRYEIPDETTYLVIRDSAPDYASITRFLIPGDDILQDKIRKIILAKNLDEVAVYKKADVDRKLFSKIRTQPDYHPNKNTLLKLCLAMQLNTEETESLLKTAGYALSRSMRTDLILRYCLTHQIFDVITVNQILDHFDEKII